MKMTKVLLALIALVSFAGSSSKPITFKLSVSSAKIQRNARLAIQAINTSDQALHFDWWIFEAANATPHEGVTCLTTTAAPFTAPGCESFGVIEIVADRADRPDPRVSTIANSHVIYVAPNKSGTFHIWADAAPFNDFKA